MNCRLSLASPELDAEDLQALTRDFCNTANREDDIRTETVYAGAAPGTKAGELVDLGQLAVTFLAAAAEWTDGRKLIIKTHNVRSGRIARTLEMVQEFHGVA
jgi:hypothetical protein